MQVEFTIWKDGRKVADASRIETMSLSEQHLKQFSGVAAMELFYFEAVDVSPPILFEHLAGRALMAFLDCSLLLVSQFADDEGMAGRHDNLRYVHGRSEVMRGTPQISAVLLAKVTEVGPSSVSLVQWVVWQPLIYSIFLNTPADQKQFTVAEIRPEPVESQKSA